MRVKVRITLKIDLEKCSNVDNYINHQDQFEKGISGIHERRFNIILDWF